MGTPVKPGAFPFLKFILPSCSVLLLFHSLHNLSVQPGKPLWATYRHSHILPKCCFLAAAHTPRGARLCSQEMESLLKSCELFLSNYDTTKRLDHLKYDEVWWMLKEPKVVGHWDSFWKVLFLNSTSAFASGTCGNLPAELCSNQCEFLPSGTAEILRAWALVCSKVENPNHFPWNS